VTSQVSCTGRGRLLDPHFFLSWTCRSSTCHSHVLLNQVSSLLVPVRTWSNCHELVEVLHATHTCCWTRSPASAQVYSDTHIASSQTSW
jgi:hypothetical protein